MRKLVFFVGLELGSHYRDPKMGFTGITKIFGLIHFVWKI